MENDLQVLIDIYNSCGGQDWTQKWDIIKGDLDKFDGVKTNKDGRVIELNLKKFGLRGMNNFDHKKIQILHLLLQT